MRNLQANGTLAGEGCKCPLSYLAKLPQFTKVEASPVLVQAPKSVELARVDELVKKVLVPSESVE